MSDNLFTKNFVYLLGLSGVKQNFVASQLSVDKATIWKWKNGTHPQNLSMLVKISKFFSEKLNIPYSLFENGQALIEKDFEKIIKDHSAERSLHINESINEPDRRGKDLPTGTQPPEPNLTTDEIEFVRTVRTLHGKETDPIPPGELLRMIRYLTRIYDFRAAWKNPNVRTEKDSERD